MITSLPTSRTLVPTTQPQGISFTAIPEGAWTAKSALRVLLTRSRTGRRPVRAEVQHRLGTGYITIAVRHGVSEDSVLLDIGLWLQERDKGRTTERASSAHDLAQSVRR